jgi:hypothetical protein
MPEQELVYSLIGNYLKLRQSVPGTNEVQEVYEPVLTVET